MIRSVSILGAALALIGSAAAQDADRLQRQIEALSSPPSAEEIRTLGANSPNAYIYFLQDFLTEAGVYGGAVSGQLTTPTIRAIVGFCREAGFAETCSRGPMRPESIAAVSQAVAEALAPPPVDETAGTTDLAAETQPEVLEPVTGAVLPEGWRFSDNGGSETMGLTVQVLSAGAAEAVVRFSGTAAQRGYFNIELSPPQPSGPGSWMAAVEGAIQRQDAGGNVWLRLSKLDDEAYLGEVFDGVPLGASGTVTGSGVAGEEVTRVMPYVQLWAEAGEVIDVTLTLKNPRLELE